MEHDFGVSIGHKRNTRLFQWPCIKFDGRVLGHDAVVAGVGLSDLEANHLPMLFNRNNASLSNWLIT